MTKRISDGELRALRNDADIAALIRHLKIPWKVRDGYFRFLCPLCSDFQTATNPRTYLARCFCGAKNFNLIDLVIAELTRPFLDAVAFLQHNAPLIPPPGVPDPWGSFPVA